MYKKIIIFSFFIFNGLYLYSQNILRAVPNLGALNSGYAQAIFDQGHAAIHSPSIPISGNLQLAAAYRQLSFGDFGLQQIDLGYRQKIFKNQQIGLQLTYLGNEAVNSTQIKILYGRRLAKELHAGISINYGLQNAEGYNAISEISADIAVYGNPIESLTIGFWSQNFISSQGIANDNASLLLSMGYELSEDFQVFASALKYTFSDLEMGFGVSYQFLEKIGARLSYLPTQSAFTIGVFYNVNHWGINAATLAHPNLGLQPMASLYYEK